MTRKQVKEDRGLGFILVGMPWHQAAGMLGRNRKLRDHISTT